MLSISPYFTESVGVAPGTTTMSLGGLGCHGCPPDEPWMYTVPPVVDTAPGNPVTAYGSDDNGTIQITQTSATAPMGPQMQPATQLPTGTIAPPSMQPGTDVHHRYARSAMPLNVYATESRLRGLRDTAPPRWGVILASAVVVFAAVLGIGYWKSRHA